MKTVSIKLPEELDARLRAIAELRRTGKSQLVREALEAYLGAEAGSRMGPAPGHRSFYDGIEDLIGCLEGPGDLSTNPEHLEGFGAS